MDYGTQTATRPKGREALPGSASGLHRKRQGGPLEVTAGPHRLKGETSVRATVRGIPTPDGRPVYGVSAAKPVPATTLTALGWRPAVNAE